MSNVVSDAVMRKWYFRHPSANDNAGLPIYGSEKHRSSTERRYLEHCDFKSYLMTFVLVTYEQLCWQWLAHREWPCLFPGGRIRPQQSLFVVPTSRASAKIDYSSHWYNYYSPYNLYFQMYFRRYMICAMLARRKPQPKQIKLTVCYIPI